MTTVAADCLLCNVFAYVLANFVPVNVCMHVYICVYMF